MAAHVNGKQKGKAQPPAAGVYRPDAIKDVAESLGITNLSDTIASALASDVEYRIQQVIEEASRFTRHARRGTMTTSDVDEALKVLNIEPLYGHGTQQPPAFRRAPLPNPVYFVEDEEIDFDRVIREEKVFLPKGVSYTAHWLAVEGVQPLVPENPPALPKTTKVTTEDSKEGILGSTSFPPTPPSDTRATSLLPKPLLKTTTQAGGKNTLVKQVLSRELQLYYARLTSSLLPPNPESTKRTAALASLRHDAGLQPLLPYLVRWVGEGVVGTLSNQTPTDTDGQVLDVLIEVLSALLANESLFVEPYLHQVLPSLLSTLLTSTLPQSLSTHLRILSSNVIARVLTGYSTTYSSLAPRIMKTLLLALLSPGKSLGTREGAVRGLIAVGKEAIRKGLVEGGGVKSLAAESAVGGSGSPELSEALVDALAFLAPPSEIPQMLDPSNEVDENLTVRLRETFGETYGQMFLMDRERALSALGEVS